MDAKTLAAQISGREYGKELTKQEAEQARAAGLVVVYGASDDLMEFEGAIYDEFGCYEGGTALVDEKGLLDRDQIDDSDDEAIADYVARKKTARSIEAAWSDAGNPCWSYKTDIPHETFEIIDEGEIYCRGIVFALADLAQAVEA